MRWGRNSDALHNENNVAGECDGGDGEDSPLESLQSTLGKTGQVSQPAGLQVFGLCRPVPQGLGTKFQEAEVSGNGGHGAASNSPAVKKMHVTSISKQKQIQESNLTHTCENKIDRTCLLKILLEEFRGDEASLFPFLCGRPVRLC